MIGVMGCLWQDTRSCLAVLRSVLQCCSAAVHRASFTQLPVIGSPPLLPPAAAAQVCAGCGGGHCPARGSAFLSMGELLPRLSLLKNIPEFITINSGLNASIVSNTF